MNTQEPAESPLEPYVAMPKGGTAPRCQRVKKNGEQCAKPARTGYSICPSHGAGYPSREQSGERRRPGRPLTTGIYSTQPTRSFAEAQAEVASLEDTLTSSDRDLLALKATLVLRLSQLEAHAPAVEQMEHELESLTAEAEQMDPTNITPEQAMSYVRRFAQLREPIARLDRLVGQVTDTATKSTTAHKTRAETKAKLSEVEGVGVFLRLLAVIRRICHNLAPDENWAATYDQALQRELLGPNGLEMPPLDLRPEEL